MLMLEIVKEQASRRSGPRSLKMEMIDIPNKSENWRVLQPRVSSFATSISIFPNSSSSLILCSSLMGALTDNRKRRALEQRLLSPLSPDSPPPPSKKSRLVEPPPSHYIAMEPQQLQHQETHQSGFGFHPSSRPVAAATRDNPSFRPRFPPPALRRPIHAPQRILKAFGLGSRSGSDKSGFDRQIPSFKKDTSTEGTSEKVESRGLKRDASFLSTQTGQNDEVVDLSGEDCNINTGSKIDIMGLGLPRSRENSAASISEGTGEIVSARGLEFKKRFSKSSKKASDLKSGLPNIPKKCLQSELGFSNVSQDILNSEFELSETPEKVWGSELVSSVMTSPEIERSTPSLEQYKKLVSSVSSRKIPLYKGLYDQSARSHDSRLRDLEFEVKLAETSIANFKLLGEILDSKHSVILPYHLNLILLVRSFQSTTKWEIMVHKIMWQFKVDFFLSVNYY